MIWTVLFLAGCAVPPFSPETAPPSVEEAQETMTVGVWFSHTELKAMFLADDGFADAFSLAVQNCARLGVTDLFVQVRPFCDALYRSALFPTPSYAAECGFDPLAYMVEEAHLAGMRLHAWINPYRLLSSGTLSDLPPDSPAANLPDTAVAQAAGGVYLKASSAEAVRLVLAGVREIACGYDVDGIHIDDYFYPTDDRAFDQEDYAAYCGTCAHPLSLDDWRRNNVNVLVAGISGICRSYALLFGTSPAADIEKNYHQLYADVAYWCEARLCDYIAPQLYFGFEYPDERFRFDRLLTVWSDLAARYDTPLYVGLAAYKIDTTQTPDCDEWSRDRDILARQVRAVKENRAKGVIFFSYSSLFSSSEPNTAERENLSDVLHEKEN